MKNWVVLSLFFCLNWAVAQQTFYYNKGHKIYLEELNNVFILNNVDSELQRTYSRFFENMTPIDNQRVLCKMGSNQNRMAEGILGDTIERQEVYSYEGSMLVLTDAFTVKLKSSATKQVLDSLVGKFQFEILGPAPYTENQYYISVGNSAIRSIDAANLFYETGVFEFSEPHFGYLNAMQSSDPHWNKQWGLSNQGQDGGTPGVDIEVERAWEIPVVSTDIRVAVVDQGVELSHPDLKNNLVQGFSCGDDSYGGIINTSYNHGTMCAGIIAATKDNGIGISGVAPFCKIIPINALARDLNSNIVGLFSPMLAVSIRWAYKEGRADVISNSWNGAPSQDVENAVKEAVTNGRDGKGCVVVFSAGNDNSNVKVPLNDKSNVIVAGAIDRCGFRAGLKSSTQSCDPWIGNKPGSNYGEGLHVVAPGSNVYTTTVNKKYARFDGTSAACPYVAGVAALMLSVNPYMRYQEVYDIIKNTATKLSNYTFQKYSDKPNGSWNNEVGYGLVNAYEATQAACNRMKIDTGEIANHMHIQSCEDVILENVTIKPQGKLTITAPGTVTFGAGFKMELGSELQTE